MNLESELTDRKKIGILGGAFDPVHIDHLKMSQIALACKFCDEVWWVPSPDLRWDKKTQFAASDRVEMLKRLLKNEPDMKVSDFEIRQGNYRGAYYLLSQLSSQHQDFDFVFIIGADSYQTLPQWRDPVVYDGTNPNGAQLMKEYDLICCPRRGYALPDPLLHRENYGRSILIPDDYWVEEFELEDGSSTKVRMDLELKGHSHSIPVSVMEYLKEHGLI